MTEIYIHRLRCPNCDQKARADRPLGCFKCGTQMEHVEKIGEIHD